MHVTGHAQFYERICLGARVELTFVSVATIYAHVKKDTAGVDSN